jgi:PAS domain S-box-containing protein
MPPQLTCSEARYDCIEYCDEISQNLCGTEKALNDTQNNKWLDEMKCVLETLNQGVIINDHRNRVVFANRLFLKMIGMTSEELVGRPVAELYPPEDVPALLKQIERREVEGQGQYEFHLPQRGGGKLPVLITARQITDPDGNKFVVVTATDITEQKRAENALRQANAELEQRHREIEEDLLLAARVQQSLAPSGLTWGKVLVETFYQPVRTIGGDFGLVAPRGANLSLMVCDVSGHGIGSALVANRIYTETMSQIERGIGLGAMMKHLNSFVKGNLGSSVFYFTMVAARLNYDDRSLEFAGAGHPPAMIIQPGEAPRLLESRSAVLGLLDDAVDNEAAIQVPVHPGDRVVIYTDGFTETFNSQKDMLGVDGFGEIVREASKLPLPEMKRQILDRIEAWRNGPAADDMSLVLIEVP